MCWSHSFEALLAVRNVAPCGSIAPKRRRDVSGISAVPNASPVHSPLIASLSGRPKPSAANHLGQAVLAARCTQTLRSDDTPPSFCTLHETAYRCARPLGEFLVPTTHIPEVLASNLDRKTSYRDSHSGIVGVAVLGCTRQVSRTPAGPPPSPISHPAPSQGPGYLQVVTNDWSHGPLTITAPINHLCILQSAFSLPRGLERNCVQTLSECSCRNELPSVGHAILCEELPSLNEHWPLTLKWHLTTGAGPRSVLLSKSDGRLVLRRLPVDSGAATNHDLTSDVYIVSIIARCASGRHVSADIRI